MATLRRATLPPPDAARDAAILPYNLSFWGVEIEENDKLHGATTTLRAALRGAAGPTQGDHDHNLPRIAHLCTGSVRAPRPSIRIRVRGAWRVPGTLINTQLRGDGGLGPAAVERESCRFR
jgi:hypothetical protein